MLTHPQVPGQCARFLRGELAHARVLPASSTAGAVRTVTAEARRGTAAIGTALAASIYAGTILRADVEDREDNETRFVWLARSGERAVRAARGRWLDGRRVEDIARVLGPGAQSPGWLVRCLDEFARREINLTKIESRPRRERLGSYMFFADLSGRADERRRPRGDRGHARRVRARRRARLLSGRRAGGVMGQTRPLSTPPRLAEPR